MPQPRDLRTPTLQKTGFYITVHLSGAGCLVTSRGVSQPSVSCNRSSTVARGAAQDGIENTRVEKRELNINGPEMTSLPGRYMKIPLRKLLTRRASRSQEQASRGDRRSGKGGQVGLISHECAASRGQENEGESSSLGSGQGRSRQ
ncbi:hypothetical protein L209DRAFT_238692 [Thermothelomyces heterothallicus CBS 203.75]